MRLVVFKFVLVRVVNGIDYLDYNCKKKMLKKKKLPSLLIFISFPKTDLD